MYAEGYVHGVGGVHDVFKFVISFLTKYERFTFGVYIVDV